MGNLVLNSETEFELPPGACLNLVSLAYMGISAIFLKPDHTNTLIPVYISLDAVSLFQSASKCSMWLNIFQHIVSVLLLYTHGNLPILLFVGNSSSLIKQTTSAQTLLGPVLPLDNKHSRSSPPKGSTSSQCQALLPRYRPWLSVPSLPFLCYTWLSPWVEIKSGSAEGCAIKYSHYS
jgi:hypothetical protein